MSSQTDVGKFIIDLDGGVFEQKLGHALSTVAAASVDHNKVGKVTVELTVRRLGDSHQVQIDHKLVSKVPTKRGEVSESNTTSTPMHVNVGGKLTLFPESQVPKGQMHLADTKTGDLVTGGNQ